MKVTTWEENPFIDSMCCFLVQGKKILHLLKIFAFYFIEKYNHNSQTKILIPIKHKLIGTSASHWVM